MNPWRGVSRSSTKMQFIVKSKSWWLPLLLSAEAILVQGAWLFARFFGNRILELRLEDFRDTGVFRARSNYAVTDVKIIPHETKHVWSLSQRFAFVIEWLVQSTVWVFSNIFLCMDCLPQEHSFCRSCWSILIAEAALHPFKIGIKRSVSSGHC